MEKESETNQTKSESGETDVGRCICGNCTGIEDTASQYCCGRKDCVTNWSFFTKGLNKSESIRKTPGQRRFYMYNTVMTGRFWDPLKHPTTLSWPDCVRSAIRSRFPDPDGKYTNYKSSETRKAEKSEPSRKRMAEREKAEESIKKSKN